MQAKCGTLFLQLVKRPSITILKRSVPEKKTLYLTMFGDTAVLLGWLLQPYISPDIDIKLRHPII